MSCSQPQASGGIGLAGVVFVVFLVLKLTGAIDWSWWWVTCPLWAVPAIFLGLVLVVGACALLYECGWKGASK